jgi:hypothetical protein
MIAQSATVHERWLNPNFELIEAVAHTGNGLVDLWEASPIRLDSNDPKTDEIIDILFPGNPLLLWVDSSLFRHTRPNALVQAARFAVHRAESNGIATRSDTWTKIIRSRFEQHRAPTVFNRRI